MSENQRLKEFEEIFSLYHTDLCRHVSRIVRDMDAAEDIVQDVFVNFWDKSQKTGIENPFGYLYRACINKALNYVSHRNRRMEIENDLYLPNHPTEIRSSDRDIEFRELEKQVLSGIETLPPMCKKVFLLSRYEEMSHKEIAAFLDISPNTVDNHIKKALSILRKLVSLRTSYATMAQYLHLLSNTTTGSPTDVWAPVTDKVRPQRSWQATLGGVVSAIQNQFELSADLYYKELKDVAEFKDGGDFVGEFLRSGPDTKFASLITKPYEERITTGIGWSYGSEWMIRKREGRTSGWLGYTLSYAMRKLEGINNNKPYPYTYDSRHSVALVLNHKLSKRLSIGGSWSYRSGYVTTLPTSSYKTYSEPVEYNPYSGVSPNANYVDDLSERNNFRMPSYHRMDLSLTHVKKKKWGERSWDISIYNAYNRQNPYYLEMTQSFTGQTFKRAVSQVSLLPILPSFSYGFKF